jgi:precorrin-6A/cobalt-precorrin-6A reductase
MRRQILILGGTSEGAELARRLAARPDMFTVTTSLAGRTSTPAALPGRLRVGGFGGADGLAAWLASERVDALVDATHPFAARMPWNAATAADKAGVPRLRLERPPWIPMGGDDWVSVSDLAAAAEALGSAKRVFLTTGRQELAPFAGRPDIWFLLRSIEAPERVPLQLCEVILGKAPFTVGEEEDLMARYGIDTLVTKNSGAAATAAKLEAARRLGVRVVMVERPPKPSGETAATVTAALAWLARALVAEAPANAATHRTVA